MNRTHSRVLLSALLVAILFGVAGWSFDRLLDTRERAEAAAQETRRCIRLAEAIEQTRRATTLGEGEALQTRQLQQIIQTAADRAQIDPDHAIHSIRPRLGQRVADSPYIEHSAELKLRLVSRKQVVTFMHALVQDNPGLQVRNLRLVAATDSGTRDDRWNADPLTLTYLVYQTPSQESGIRRVTQR